MMDFATYLSVFTTRASNAVTTTRYVLPYTNPESARPVRRS